MKVKAPSNQTKNDNVPNDKIREYNLEEFDFKLMEDNIENIELKLCMNSIWFIVLVFSSVPVPC